MQRIEHRSLRHEHLFGDVERGRIKIPQFQRCFVWSKEQTASLIDSILKGLPMKKNSVRSTVSLAIFVMTFVMIMALHLPDVKLRMRLKSLLRVPLRVLLLLLGR